MKNRLQTYTCEDITIYRAEDGYTTTSRLGCQEHESIYWHRNCGYVEMFLGEDERKTRIYYIENEDQFNQLVWHYKQFMDLDLRSQNGTAFKPSFPTYLGVEQVLGPGVYGVWKMIDPARLNEELSKMFTIVKCFVPSFEPRCAVPCLT